MTSWMLRTLWFLPLWVGGSVLLGGLAWLASTAVNAIDRWWLRRAIDHETRAAVQLQREQERRLAAVISITERRSAR